MPRTAEPPTVTPVRIINPHSVLTLAEAQELLRLGEHSLRREARRGRLRVSRRCGKLWTTGKWLLEWLEGGEVRRTRREPGDRNGEK